MSSKISSKVLGLKFMQRAKEKEVRESLEKEQSNIISDSHWYIPVEKEIKKEINSLIIEQDSFMSFIKDNGLRRQNFDSSLKRKLDKSEADNDPELIKKEEITSPVSESISKEKIVPKKKRKTEGLRKISK